MHIILKILGGLAALAVVLVLLGYWVLAGSPVPTLTPSRTPAPDGFDAAAYVDFSDATSTDQAQVLNLGDFGQPFEHYILPDLGITYFILFQDDGTRRTLFIDASGTLVGDISDAAVLFPMGHFMVAPDGYYEVTQRGVSERQPMIEIGPIEEADLDRMIAESTHYRAFEPEDLPTDDPDRIAERSVHVMRHEGIWKRAESAKLGYRDWKGVPFYDLDAQYRIPRAVDTGEAQNFFGGRYRVELTYFDQQEYLPKRGAQIGSPTGQGRAAQWTGTGYYTVFDDDTPTLRFRIENDREILSSSGPVQMIVEGSPQSDFVVIKRTNSNNQNTVIVVSVSVTPYLFRTSRYYH